MTTIGDLPDVHVNPAVIGARVEALDHGIAALAAHADEHREQLGKSFHAALSAFVRRWQIERDSYRDWTARALRVDWGARIMAFEAHYLDWAKRTQARIDRPEPRTRPAAQRSMADAIVPSEMWWLIAGVTAYVALRRI